MVGQAMRSGYAPSTVLNCNKARPLHLGRRNPRTALFLWAFRGNGPYVQNRRLEIRLHPSFLLFYDLLLSLYCCENISRT
jgi:hypothetical protein